MLRKILIVFSLSLGLVLSCTCPTSAPAAPSQLVANSNFVVQDQIIDGVNYGKPFVLGNLIFLPGDFSVSRGTTSISPQCPSGYRLPTADEYSALLTALGSSAYSSLTKTDGYNMQSGKYYMTSTKTYPGDTYGGNASAWEFKSLFLSGTTVSVKSVCTYFYTAQMTSRCVQDIEGVSLTIDMPEKDLVTGVTTSFTLNTASIKGFAWKTNNKVTISNPLKAQYANSGCYLLEVWGINLLNNVVYYCKPVRVITQMGSDANSSFDLSKVSTVDTGVKTYRNSQMFFSHTQAPMAPRSNGGYYILYTANPDKVLHIRYTESSTAQPKDVNLNIDGYPMDIIETDYGLAIYALSTSDTNYAFIVGLEKNTFRVKFNKTVMNNGSRPTTLTEQITFYGSSSVPLFGMEAMHEPENGKLAYGRGRLSLIFAHYNNFGAETTSRNDHTGDTYITLDDNGEDVKYAWAWGSSHSLVQSHIYTGRYFVTAALGDAYPMGIKVCVIDGDSTSTTFDPVHQRYARHNSYCKDDVVPSFTGTMTGNTYGRLGGLINLGDKFAVVFSVKPTSSDATNALQMVTFKYANGAFTDITRYTLLTGIASSLVNLRASKYGNKILISYTLNSTSFADSVPPRMYNNLSDTMYYLLVNQNGIIANGPLQAAEHQMNLSDDIREMKDGSLLWTYVDSSNNLKVVTVKAPSA